MACRVTENAPEITAWEAITVAIIARITIGTRAHDGTSRKNGFAVADGSCRISADWPRYCRVSAGNTTKNQARAIAGRPKWPMSAYRASAPVMTRTTAPTATNAMYGCETMKVIA